MWRCATDFMSLRGNGPHLTGQMGDFLERNESGTASVVTFQAVDARLCSGHAVNDDIVQAAAARGNGNIIFGIDASQIALWIKWIIYGNRQFVK